jgi:ACS family hexuronate transporter-like MFS transporter
LKKIKGFRWWIVTLIGIATVINYIDRNSLAIMWVDISAEVGLDKNDYAAIVSVFMVMYALGQSVSGRLFDWIGTRIGFTVSIFVWSLACALHGTARTILGFSIFRGLLGLSESGPWPGATKSNAEWHPAHERAFAQGIFNAGASIGAVISAPLIALLYIYFGWKATFVIIGVLGFLWIVPWLIINKSTPEKHPWLTDKERDYILTGRIPKENRGKDVEEQAPSWGKLLTYKESWSVIAGRFFFDPIWWMFVTWLPIYLTEQFGFDIKQIGLFAWVPYVGAAIGSLVGGYYSGYLMNKGWSLNKARKIAIVTGAIITVPAMIVSAFAATPLIAVILIAVILFGFQFSMQNLQTLPSDFFSGKTVGSLAGLGGTSAITGVLIMVWIVPAITTTSYVPFFLMGAILAPLGVLCVYLFGGEIKRVELKEEIK